MNPNKRNNPTVSRRRILLASSAALPLLAGCTGDDPDGGSEDGESADDDEASSDEENSNDGDENPSEEENPEEEGDDGEEEAEEGGDEQLVEPGESFSMDGEGDAVSDEFTLSEGIATVEFEHDGERNFITDMLALDGEEWDDKLLVNVIGAIEGRSVIPVDGGTYQLDVQADGAWRVAIEQPGVTRDDVESPPASFEGQGPDYVGPLELEGVTEVAGTHDGESNFIVEARTAEGGFGGWDLIINEIGEYEGEATTRVEGIAWIDINADGSWTLEIE